jgi:hypothetical protein
VLFANADNCELVVSFRVDGQKVVVDSEDTVTVFQG